MLRLSVGVAYGSPYKFFLYFPFIRFFVVSFLSPFCLLFVSLSATLPMLRLSVGPSAPVLKSLLPFKHPLPILCFT